MNFRFFFFLFILAPVMVFSQPIKKKDLPGGKDDYKASFKFYREGTDLSRASVVSYVKLISGLKGYGRKDSLQANKLISHLNKHNENVFYKLMRIRLQWSYQRRLLTTELHSLQYSLNNKEDSAYRYYLLACLYKGKLDSVLARKFGFVKAGADGIEYVDWEKIQQFKWNDPRVIEMFSDHSLDNNLYNKPRSFFSSPSLIRLTDTCVANFNKAIEVNTNEFFYLQEYVLFLSTLRQETTIQEIITARRSSYEGKKRRWLEQQLTYSFYREKRGK